jgi:hypothetical protein
MTDVKRLGLDDWLSRAAELQPQTEAFIDGRFVPAASGRTFTDIGPRDGRPIAEVAEADATDVDRAVTAPGRRSRTAAGPTSRRRTASASCSGWPS